MTWGYVCTHNNSITQILKHSCLWWLKASYKNTGGMHHTQRQHVTTARWLNHKWICTNLTTMVTPWVQARNSEGDCQGLMTALCSCTINKNTCLKDTWKFMNAAKWPTWSCQAKSQPCGFLVLFSCCCCCLIFLQQEQSINQAYTCCHTDTEAADWHCYLTQSQYYTDTRPNSPHIDLVMPHTVATRMPTFQDSGMAKQGFELQAFLAKGSSHTLVFAFLLLLLLLPPLGKWCLPGCLPLPLPDVTRDCFLGPRPLNRADSSECLAAFFNLLLPPDFFAEVFSFAFTEIFSFAFAEAFSFVRAEVPTDPLAVFFCWTPPAETLPDTAGLVSERWAGPSFICFPFLLAVMAVEFCIQPLVTDCSCGIPDLTLLDSRVDFFPLAEFCLANFGEASPDLVGPVAHLKFACFFVPARPDTEERFCFVPAWPDTPEDLEANLLDFTETAVCRGPFASADIDVSLWALASIPSSSAGLFWALCLTPLVSTEPEEAVGAEWVEPLNVDPDEAFWAASAEAGSAPPFVCVEGQSEVVHAGHSLTLAKLLVLTVLSALLDVFRVQAWDLLLLLADSRTDIICLGDRGLCEE